MIIVMNKSGEKMCYKEIYFSLHNEYGPAIFFKAFKQYKSYWNIGKLHNLFGPAIINLHIKQCKYFIHGVEYEETAWRDKNEYGEKPYKRSQYAWSL